MSSVRRCYSKPMKSSFKRSLVVATALWPGLTSAQVDPAVVPSTVSADAGEVWFQRTQRQIDAARSETTRLAREEVAAYCEHSNAAHDSEAAQLRSPWVTARGMTLQRGEVGAGDRDVSPRFRAGLGVSFSDWWRAGLVEERGRSVCALYQAQVELRAPQTSIEALSLDGWKKKVTLLRQAVLDADEIIDRSELELTRGERTVVEHMAVLSDYQQLEQQLSHAQMEVARLAFVRPPVALNPEAINALRNSVADVERAEGALRRNKAIAVDVEGGYDEIVGTEQQLPIYGQVNVTFRPGYFWQSSLDATSEAARARAAALSAIGAQGQFREVVVGVAIRRGPMEHELQRLRELIVLLQQKYDTLRPLTRPDAQRLGERLWFQLRLSNAEVAHLEASLAAMNRWLAAVR